MDKVTLTLLILNLFAFWRINKKLNTLQANDEEVANAVFILADYIESDMQDAKQSQNLIKKISKAGVQLIQRRKKE